MKYLPGIPDHWTPLEQHVRDSAAWQHVYRHDRLPWWRRWLYRRKLKRAGWSTIPALRWRCVEADTLAQGRRQVGIASGAGE